MTDPDPISPSEDELNSRILASLQRAVERHGVMAESVFFSVLQKVEPEQWTEWYGSSDAWPFPFDPYPITDEILLKAGIEPSGTATGTDAELPQFCGSSPGTGPGFPCADTDAAQVCDRPLTDSVAPLSRA